MRVDPADELADAVFADGGDAVQTDNALDWLGDGEGDEDVGEAPVASMGAVIAHPVAADSLSASLLMIRAC